MLAGWSSPDSETFSRAVLVFKYSESHKYPQKLLIGMTLITPTAKPNQIMPYKPRSSEEAVCPRSGRCPTASSERDAVSRFLFSSTGMTFCCLM